MSPFGWYESIKWFFLSSIIQKPTTWSDISIILSVENFIISPIIPTIKDFLNNSNHSIMISCQDCQIFVQFFSYFELNKLNKINVWLFFGIFLFKFLKFIFFRLFLYLNLVLYRFRLSVVLSSTNVRSKLFYSCRKFERFWYVQCFNHPELWTCQIDDVQFNELIWIILLNW